MADWWARLERTLDPDGPEGWVAIYSLIVFELERSVSAEARLIGATAVVARLHEARARLHHWRSLRSSRRSAA